MFTFHEGGLLVLTEDLLSAYKVVKAGYNSLALLGTKLDVLSQTEAMCHKEVVVWLDDDHAGQTGALSIRRQLNPVTNAHNVCFKQPKECTISQIKEQINNVRTPF
jgi:DNA primase